MSLRRRKDELDGKIAGLYDLEETIGQGHFAVVKLARHVFTGEKVAVKVIDKTKLDEVSKAHLFQEVRCMKLVQHPNVVRLYEVIDTQTKLYLILELGDGGDMYDFIMKHNNGLTEDFARNCFKQLVQAISYCHRLHVVHRDLKPENVIFFEKLGIVKLTDFGFSNKYVPGKHLETSCGSLAYSAPEILLGDSYDPPAVDVWSLGVLLYMLVCGEPPFQEANDSETLTMIMDCRYRMPLHVSSECQNLISMLLNREPSKRPNLYTIMKHNWLKSESIPIHVDIPLISYEKISDAEHSFIVMKMVEGEIASHEDILKSLEKDEYNHITATYYLLAERRLKRQHTHVSMQNQVGAAGLRLHHNISNKPKFESLSLSPRIQPSNMTPEQLQHHHVIESLISPPCTQPSLSPLLLPFQPDQGMRLPSTSGKSNARKFSLIKEESLEEDSETEEMDIESIHKVKFAKTTDDCTSDDSESLSSSSETNLSRRPRNLRRPHSTHSKSLHSVKSSPQLLNQIFEEGESEGEECLPAKMGPRMVKTRNSVASPEILRKFAHKLRIKKKHPRRHGASCSSSDASDTDDKEKRKRKDKLKHHFHRRDSSDHSSDTDGPGGFGGPGTNGGSNIQQSSKDGNSSNSCNNQSPTGQNQNNNTGNDNSTGKQQSTLAPVAEQPNEKLAETSSEDICIDEQNSQNAEGGKDKCTESAKLDILKVSQRGNSTTSNLSNLSLNSSIRSSSSKYKLDTDCFLHRRELSNDSMNNLFFDSLSRASNTRLIHVMSREFSDKVSDKFSDICERFSRASSREGSIRSESVSMCSADCGLNHVKGHKRSRDRVKVDLNCNGFSQEEMLAERNNQSALAEKKEPVKCCCVS